MKEDKIIENARKSLSKLKEKVNLALCGKLKRNNKFEWMYLSDINDYINYYQFIIDGEYKKAWDIQNDMDTSPRDEIPSYFYDFIRDVVEK